MLKALAQGDIERIKKRYASPDIEWVDTDKPEPGSLEMVVLDHLLQLSTPDRVHEVIDAYSGLLVEGGELVVIVPSLEWACNQYVQHDDPPLAAFVSLYGTPGLGHRSGFTLMQLRALLESHPDLRVTLATGEWYVSDISGKLADVMQNTVHARKLRLDPGDAIA